MSKEKKQKKRESDFTGEVKELVKIYREKPGYKKTKLGWIPEDWEVVRLGEVARLSKSKFDPTKNSNVYICIELEHLSQNTGQKLGHTFSNLQSSTKNKFNKGGSSPN